MAKRVAQTPFFLESVENIHPSHFIVLTDYCAPDASGRRQQLELVSELPGIDCHFAGSGKRNVW